MDDTTPNYQQEEKVGPEGSPKEEERKSGQ
jgi:hypothetical protein